MHRRTTYSTASSVAMMRSAPVNVYGRTFAINASFEHAIGTRLAGSLTYSFAHTSNLNRFIDLAPFPSNRQFYLSVDVGW